MILARISIDDTPEKTSPQKSLRLFYVRWFFCLLYPLRTISAKLALFGEGWLHVIPSQAVTIPT